MKGVKAMECYLAYMRHVWFMEHSPYSIGRTCNTSDTDTLCTGTLDNPECEPCAIDL